MMKYIFLTIAICAVHFVGAQVDLQARAAELAENESFLEASSLWGRLANYETDVEVQRMCLRSAIDCAMRGHAMDEAFEYSSKLLEFTGLETLDFERHMELSKLFAPDFDPISFLQVQISLAGSDANALNALIRREQMLDSLRGGAQGAYEIELLHPFADRPEFAAVPFGKGLIYMTTFGDRRIHPVKDGKTGGFTTELILQPDTSDMKINWSWSEEMFGEELFLEMGSSKLHDGPVRFDEEQDFAVLTRSQERSNHSDSAMIQTELVLFWKRFFGWEPAHEFEWNSSTYSNMHGTFDREGNLIFSSDMPGGFGGMDLYRSVWEDGGWSKPENLGSSVNTVKDEVFPFIAASGNLYFSSNGHFGFGGLDLFISQSLDQNPRNLGEPMNSSMDDFAIIFDEATGKGYLSSDRRSGVDALFSVSGESGLRELEIQVLNCQGESMAGAGVEVSQGSSGEVARLRTNDEGMCTFQGWKDQTYSIRLALRDSKFTSPPKINVSLQEENEVLVLDMGTMVRSNTLSVQDLTGKPLEGVLLVFQHPLEGEQSFLSDAQGEFHWNHATRQKEFTSVNASIINFEDASEELEWKVENGCVQPLDETITMKPIEEVVELIDLNAIYYDFGSSALRQEGKAELDKLVLYMEKRPQIRLELSSHTDCRGEESRNLSLSQERAERCIAYIISKGISPYRIEAKGYGEKKPVNQCTDRLTCDCAPLNVIGCDPCNEALHQQNRRTELRLLTGDDASSDNTLKQ